MKIVSENGFSGKTYLYSIGPCADDGDGMDRRARRAATSGGQNQNEVGGILHLEKAVEPTLPPWWEMNLMKTGIFNSTVIGARMSHWKWRETKLQPSRVRSGHKISCCLVSLHFLCDILAPITVDH